MGSVHAQAEKQAAQLAGLERMGDPFAKSYVNDMQRRAIAAIKGGGNVKLTKAERDKAISEMADFMLLGFVRRYRQKKQTLGIELNLSFSRDVKKIAKGLDLDLDGIRDSLEKSARKRINSSLDTMEERINGALHTISGRQQTTDVATREMHRRLNDMGLSLKNPSMAETLVRTHAQLAFGAAQWQLNQDDPHDTIWGYMYSAVGDDRTRPEHMLLDGLVREKADPIWKTIWTPNGWNSVPPETPIYTANGEKPIAEVKHGDLVLTHRGRFRPVFELHRHKGPNELVTVSLDESAVVANRTLCLTGNHQVFTKRGWIDAASLKMGDEVACPTLAATDYQSRVNVNNLLHRYFASECAIADGARPNLMPLQFNSQRQRRQVEVQPILTKALVESPCDFQGVQDSSEQFFGSAHVGLGVGVPRRGFSIRSDLGGREFLLDALATGRRRHLQRGRCLLGPIRVERVGDDLGVMAAAQLLSVMGEHPPDAAKLNASPLGGFGDGAFVGSVVSKKSRDTSGPMLLETSLGLRQISERSVLSHAAIVPLQWVRIKALGRMPWHCADVFNLAVAEDNSYVASGIAIHNCRCQIIELVEPQDVTPIPKGAGPDPGFDFNPAQLLAA